MIKELEKLSRLASFNSVMIITPQGDPLYCSNHDQDLVIVQKSSLLRNLLKQVSHTANALLCFEKGVGVVSSNSLGRMVLLLHDGSEKDRAGIFLEELRNMCENHQFKRDILLSILQATHVSMKPRVIRKLATLADDTVAKYLLEILKNVDVSNLPQITGFIQEIFSVLGLCCGYEDASIIQDFIKRGKREGKLGIHLERSAQNLYKQLTAKKKKHHPGSSASGKGGADDGQNDKIAMLVEAGKLDEAGHLVMEEIKKAVNRKQFIKAEKLRQRLIAVNPAMLTEIIRAAEIIEEEQMASIPVAFKETWSMLSEILADDEFAALYHRLTYKNCKTGEVLVSQGTFSSGLFFIQSGSLQVYGISEGKEILMHVAGEGKVVGGSSFFESSVWTVNVRSLGADVYTLTKEQLASLVEMFPGIESKLMDFCATEQSVDNVFTRKEKNRRKIKRIMLEGRILMALLGKDGKEIGTGVRGDLFDISMGGVSFSVSFGDG